MQVFQKYESIIPDKVPRGFNVKLVTSLETKESKHIDRTFSHSYLSQTD